MATKPGEEQAVCLLSFLSQYSLSTLSGQMGRGEHCMGKDSELENEEPWKDLAEEYSRQGNSKGKSLGRREGIWGE